MTSDMLIGRHEEKRLLTQYVDSGRSEFIALFGRRRVGKTFLVRNFFQNDFAFDVTGVLEGSRNEQFSVFYTALKAYGYEGKKPTTWIDMFFALRQLLETKIENGKRTVIFIDELPCFDTPKSGFVNALGHFWNSWANWQSEIMLIVCGSATSWMVRNVIDNHGGLHDRITHEMALRPFTLAECEEYFHSKGFSWQRLGVLQAYMAVGGVPYYMSLFRVSDSPAIGIDRLFFSENAEMAREYRRLFSSLFRNPQPYLDIISLLVKHPEGMTREEIAKSLEIDNNGRLGNQLTDLVYCDFVRRYNVRSNRIKTNSAIFQLVDFYTIFYNTIVLKHIGDEHYWSRNIETPTVNTWHGLAFERICQAHIPQIKKSLGIYSVRTENYAWRCRKDGNGAQIDIIIDRADSAINLCEVKYSKSEYVLDKEEYMKMANRLELFRMETGTKHALIPTLITTFGVKSGLYKDHVNVILTLDDLFV